MPQASGIFKQVALKREVTYGTVPAASGSQLMRRVQSTIDLSKDTYQSNEIRTDFQISDFRHGVRRVKGSLQGELSPKTYSDVLSAVLKRDFTAGVSATGMSITIAGTAPAFTLTRAAGSFLTDGFKVGDVVRLTAGSFNVVNINKNLLITALTATVATVMTLNGSSLVAEGPIASATMAVQGKKTYIPTTGHTDVSYSIEHWFNDISQSEVFSGVKFDKATIDLPPTGMAKVSFDILGQNIVTAASRYFTSPTAVPSTGVLAAVNGVLLVNGAVQAVVTGLNIVMDPTVSGDPVVGANAVPYLFPGPVNVTGQFTAYFTDATLRDLFVNETETSLIVTLTTDNTATADVIAFTLPRIKVGGASKNDGTGGLVQTFPFQALINNAGGTGTSSEQTTIVMQDTRA
jgi:Phage tail tube protein